jgi:hypothetical protein
VGASAATAHILIRYHARPADHRVLRFVRVPVNPKAELVVAAPVLHLVGAISAPSGRFGAQSKNRQLSTHLKYQVNEELVLNKIRFRNLVCSSGQQSPHRLRTLVTADEAICVSCARSSQRVRRLYCFDPIVRCSANSDKLEIRIKAIGLFISTTPPGKRLTVITNIWLPFVAAALCAQSKT